MNIKTKFNIGDTAYIKEDGKVNCKTLQIHQIDIVIFNVDGIEKVRTSYGGELIEDCVYGYNDKNLLNYKEFRASRKKYLIK